MGGTVIARYEVEITSGTIPTNPQTPPTYTVNYSPGIDIGAGIGAVGGDLEVTYNPNLGGYNVESSTAVGGWVLNQTFSGGVNGFGWGFQGGVGGIWGNPLINGEVFTGVEGGIEINIKTGDITVRQGGVVEGSVGVPVGGKVSGRGNSSPTNVVVVNVYDLISNSIAQVWGGGSDANDRDDSSSPNTPRPSDEAIQTSRDIVAGKLIDSFTGQIVYADAIIRGVAAAKKKREQEIAEAAAWQREHNRDRQDGGSSSNSSSSSSTSPQTGSVPQPARPGDGGASGGFSYHDSTYGTGNATYTPVYDNHADRPGFPIVIDLDGDGVEISPLGGSTARFDYDNDGFKELTAWVGKDDGLLVYDVGNDGLITQTCEVVIAEWTADTTDTDLDALKAVYFNAGRRWDGANWNSRPRLRAAG